MKTLDNQNQGPAREPTRKPKTPPQAVQGPPATPRAFKTPETASCKNCAKQQQVNPTTASPPSRPNPKPDDNRLAGSTWRTAAPRPSGRKNPHGRCQMSAPKMSQFVFCKILGRKETPRPGGAPKDETLVPSRQAALAPLRHRHAKLATQTRPRGTTRTIQ